DQLIVNPQNQGTVSGSNLLSNVLTNVDTTTLDSLTLGDTVYNDKNFNSQFDAGDTGINGVALTLFDDTNHDNVFDAGDTQIATTTTSNGGKYSFTGLAPGDYIVRVDASNFTAGGALTIFKNASPIVAADPDGNVDNDNDAQPLSGGIVVTKAITLAYNTEPTAGTGNDTNNTLDLGFVENQPPTISGTASTVSFTEGQAVTLSSTLSVSDPDNVNLANATVKIAGGTFSGDGDVLSTSTTGT